MTGGNQKQTQGQSGGGETVESLKKQLDELQADYDELESEHNALLDRTGGESGATDSGQPAPSAVISANAAGEVIDPNAKANKSEETDPSGKSTSGN